MSARAALTVLGIDPGTASTGYGVVSSRGSELTALCGGVIRTPAREPLERRLGAILDEVDALLDEHVPAAVAVEEIFFGRNVRTAFAVGQARGVVLGAAGRRGIACFAYTPQARANAVSTSFDKGVGYAIDRMQGDGTLVYTVRVSIS